MSPEQAMGREADARSDQFSLGAVLYELITGRRAFDKPTTVETLSAIVRDEVPPIRDLQPATPMPVAWIVERCLQKDPSERYASTRDLARDLANARDRLSELTGRTETYLPSPRRSFGVREIAAWAAAAALAVTALVINNSRGSSSPPASVIRFTLNPPASAQFTSGLFGAAVAGSLRGKATRIHGGSRRPQAHSGSSPSIPAARPLPDTDFATGPFWSPTESNRVFSRRSLKRIAINGVESKVIADTTAAGGGGATWNARWRDRVCIGPRRRLIASVS
jgi:serine/threonine protein kinase